MAEKVINTRSGKVWLTEDGIIRQNVVPHTDFTLQDAQETIAAAVKLSEGKPLPMLVDLTGLKSITKEARNYFGKEVTSHNLSAVGLLFTSAVTQVLGNFFLRFNRPEIPVKLFNSETQAIRWLKEFLS